MTLVQPSSKVIAWQYAIERHLCCLSAAQKKIFTAPATAEDCLELILQAQGRKKFDRFMVALRPLIEPLKRFEGSIDVLVQAQSGILSPIWVWNVTFSNSRIPADWNESGSLADGGHCAYIL